MSQDFVKEQDFTANKIEGEKYLLKRRCKQKHQTQRERERERESIRIGIFAGDAVVRKSTSFFHFAPSPEVPGLFKLATYIYKCSQKARLKIKMAKVKSFNKIFPIARTRPKFKKKSQKYLSIYLSIYTMVPSK